MPRREKTKSAKNSATTIMNGCMVARTNRKKPTGRRAVSFVRTLPQSRCALGRTNFVQNS